MKLNLAANAKKLNLYIGERDRDILKRLELKLYDERKSISQFFIEAARQYLDKKDKNKCPKN